MKASALALALLLLLAACGDSSDTSDDAARDATTTSAAASDDGGSDGDADDDATGDDGGDGGDEFTGSGSGDICALAADFEENDPFGDDVGFDAFNSEFFDRIDDIFGRVVDAAPAEIRDDAITMRDGFRQFGDTFEEYDYDLFDPELATALESFDTAEIEAATERVERYLTDVCGIDLDDDDATVGPDDTEGAATAAAALSQTFGIDAELAECLAEELGDFDVENPDPSLLTEEVCGTTLLEIMTNFGG